MTLLPGSFKAIGFVGATLSSSDVGSLTPPPGTSGALIQVTGGNATWRDDGVDPTSAAGGGLVMVADTEPQWFSGGLSTLRFIAAGEDTFLLVAYYA
jgi:hypothetical protein